ncbi:ADSL, partial [Cordylochernes scorpioides]
MKLISGQWCCQDLGLVITDAQIKEMEANINNLDLPAAEKEERLTRHDVMAHVHVFAQQCPLASPIIHLGATSCYVGDNTPCLHSQTSHLKSHPTEQYVFTRPAQPTTVGKRACLWLQDLVTVLQDLEHVRGGMRFRGLKGTTGTQASFLQLFHGDHSKLQYKDSSEHQMFVVQIAADIRLLANKKELEEPFEKQQIGSSAMPYKRNPMRCERICGMAKLLRNILPNTLDVAADQWLERTLDDSVNRRETLPRAFLYADSLLEVLQNVLAGLVVYKGSVEQNLARELPFMAVEALLMAMVSEGGADRQDCHERLRVLAQQAGTAVKHTGGANDLVDRIRADPYFAPILPRLDDLLNPAEFVGRAPEQ